MRALDLVAGWPVDHVSAAVDPAVDAMASARSSIDTIGDVDRRYRLASLAKPITAWAVLIAVEEGLLALDHPIGQPGCTLRHLLAHAGGYAFDGAEPISAPGRRRIYSNTGIEMAAAAVASRRRDAVHRVPGRGRVRAARHACVRAARLTRARHVEHARATCAGSSTN